MSLLMLLSALGSTSPGGGTPPPTGSAPKVILDTDFDTDCGDIGALVTAIGYHKAGLIDLIGVVTCSHVWLPVKAIRAVLDYYGLSAVPVGGYYGSNGYARPSIATVIADNFPTPGDHVYDYPEAKAIYRQLLATNSDVTVVAIGFLNAFRTLLDSAPDDASGLTGLELCAASVSQVVAVAGIIPDSSTVTNGAEYNVSVTPADWAYFTDNHNVPLTWVGIEQGDDVGVLFPQDNIALNPAQYGWKYWMDTYSSVAPDGRRPAWDQLGLVAVAKPSMFTVGGTGKNAINATTGANVWQEGAGTQTYLVKAVSDAAFVAEIEAVQTAAQT